MIAGILLAAGRSRRFGANKLLCSYAGVPLAVVALRNLRQGVDEVFAVVRADDAELIRLLEQENAHIVSCPAAGRGMGASLACGVRASGQAQGWLVALADMPCIPPTVIGRLGRRLASGAALVAPVCNGRRGHPVGFSREFFEALCRLDGDSGARFLLEANADRLECIACDDPGIFLDIDTPAHLQARPGPFPAAETNFPSA